MLYSTHGGGEIESNDTGVINAWYLENGLPLVQWLITLNQTTRGLTILLASLTARKHTRFFSLPLLCHNGNR